MSKSIEAIREALAAGPTPGVWAVTPAGDVMKEDFAGSLICAVQYSRAERSANAAFIAACSPAAITELLAAHDAALSRASEVEAQTIERCATAAWNHFMDTCKRFGLPPTGREDWCAARAIRSMRPTGDSGVQS